MFDHDRALDMIERATDQTPSCPACFAHTEVADEGGRLVLRCSAAADPRGGIERISAALLPHLHRSLLDLREDVAA